jgi:hypothetical protein
MKPEIEFKRGSLRKIKKSEDYLYPDPEDDSQICAQKERESKILSKIYYQEENIPKNPGMEMMKKCDAKEQQIVKGASLAKYYREFKLQQEEELKAQIMQRKSDIIKILKIENTNIMNIDYFKEKLGQDTIDKLGSEKFAKLTEYIKEWGNKDTQSSGNNLLTPETLPSSITGAYLSTNLKPNLKVNDCSSGVKVNSISDESMQHINYLKGLSQNYRTIPCKNYHGSQGCGRSRFCHFIHLSDYEGINAFKSP